MYQEHNNSDRPKIQLYVKAYKHNEEIEQIK